MSRTQRSNATPSAQPASGISPCATPNASPTRSASPKRGCVRAAAPRLTAAANASDASASARMARVANAVRSAGHGIGLQIGARRSLALGDDAPDRHGFHLGDLEPPAPERDGIAGLRDASQQREDHAGGGVN